MDRKKRIRLHEETPRPAGVHSARLDALRDDILGCTVCAEHLPLGPRPVVQIHHEAPILIAGQAPGRRVHESGVPFQDPSGDRLREWMGVDEETFYDPRRVAILPMGFCFPGTGASGDLPPRPECAETWRARVLAELTGVRLTIVLGRYAQDYHLDSGARTVTEAVSSWRARWPDVMPLPHPSPRNQRWLKRNPWFERDVLPRLRERVREVLAVLFVVIAAGFVMPGTGSGQATPGAVEIPVQGATLAGTEMGAGPPIIAIHGGPSLGHRYLVEPLGRLAADHRVLLYDQRGTGRSVGEGEVDEFGYGRLIEDIEAVAAWMGAERFVLLGHSWGAHLALSYALARPETLAALVLTSPVEPGSRYVELQERTLRERTTEADSVALSAAFSSPEFRQGTVEGVDALFRAMYRPWFADPGDAERLEIGLNRAQVERARATGAMITGGEEGGVGWTDLRGGWSIPTLIVHGAEDPVPLEAAEALHRELEGSRLEVMSDVGHFPMLERPEALASLIAGFLESLALPPS